MDQVNHVVETGKAHSQGAYFQLQEEDNLPVRVGVIAGAGTLGLLLGLRGRLVKRVLYTGLGTGVGAAVCYPDQAKETLNAVETETKNLVSTAYSLVTGETSPSLPSLEPSSVDMSLIASGIRRSLYFLMAKGKDLYKLASEKVAVVMQEQKVDVKKEVLSSSSAATPAIVSSVVFVDPATQSTVESEGDPGMATEEDKDLYTTRGN